MKQDQLETWVTALSQELDIDVTGLDTQALLDVARDAAHSVMRPAAPLATFLVGYAAGVAGTGLAGVEEASAKASALALDWPQGDE
ncbi:DUF6457 domain-containing protein [Demequina sp. TTPB684]|uniref:DUF6457 domain-containing protein n=1 Tax=unclassified Demequina TaxID=2620311 RepID=UPI001CF20C1D|nr:MULTISPECIES: DUF6457 domain-containing protein [unclassified Demequina]MCB2412116.1 DUF6457 domain-containing protein [Demequina sp. TTPB684]UPU88903.1 DUF6457 domain-containing protein [Demequina sp. TMPB413]